MAGLAVSNGRGKQVGAFRARAEHLGVRLVVVEG